MSTSRMRTTVTLPRDLIAAADEAVQRGKARNRNELVRIALQHELAAQARADIDAAFVGMEDDAEYQAETAAIMAEFSDADWEAFQDAEESHGW